MWSMISNQQWGAKPEAKMWKPTCEVINLMSHSDEYKYAWLIDFTEAFNLIH